MKRLIVSLIAIGIFIVAGTASAQVNLVYNNSWSKDDPQTGVIPEVWIERIEQATQGRVRIRHVFGAALLKGEGTLEGVRKGVADAGAVVIVYHIGELPMSAALAGSFDVEYGNRLELFAVNAITRKLYEEFPKFQQEYKNLGVKPLLFLPAGQYSIIGNVRLASVEDFKDAKIRAFGSSLPKFFESLGAIPLAVASGEMYTSLQTGVIDATITNPTLMMPGGLFEVSKYVTTTGPGMGTSLAGPSVAVTINLESWNKIAPKDQALIERVSAAMEPVAAHMMTQATQEAYEKLAKAGIEILHLGQDDLRKIAKMAPDFFKREEERLNERGLPGTELFKRYRELADAYAAGEWQPWKIAK